MRALGASRSNGRPQPWFPGFLAHRRSPLVIQLNHALRLDCAGHRAYSSSATTQLSRTRPAPCRPRCRCSPWRHRTVVERIRLVAVYSVLIPVVAQDEVAIRPLHLFIQRLEPAVTNTVGAGLSLFSRCDEKSLSKLIATRTGYPWSSTTRIMSRSLCLSCSRLDSTSLIGKPGPESRVPRP